GAGRQHDDAAATALPPDGDGLALMLERLVRITDAPGCLLIGTGVVLIGQFLAEDVLDDGPVVNAARAIAAGARIELNTGQDGEPLGGRIGSEDGAAVEGEADRLVHAAIVSPPAGSWQTRHGEESWESKRHR